MMTAHYGNINQTIIEFVLQSTDEEIAAELVGIE
jgi:hypothetical protein